MNLSAKMADEQVLQHNLLPNPVRIPHNSSKRTPAATARKIVYCPKKNTKRAKIALRRENRLNKLAKTEAKVSADPRLTRSEQGVVCRR